MPLPNPRPSETEQDWMSRCMGDDEMQAEFPDQKQRTAVCAQKWRDKDTRATEAHERRYLPACELRVSTGDDGVRRLTGYAAVFDSLSEKLRGFFGDEFRERITPGAFKKSLERGDDVHAKIEHQGGVMTLGRRKAGTLSLKEDDRGLLASITPPDTSAGRDVVELVRRGDLSNMSFAFDVKGEAWEKVDGEEIRVLSEVDLFDVSIVAQPAYPDTTVALRSRDGWKTMKPPDAATDKTEETEEPESTADRLKRMDLTYATERVKSGSRWGRQEK